MGLLTEVAHVTWNTLAGWPWLAAGLGAIAVLLPFAARGDNP